MSASSWQGAARQEAAEVAQAELLKQQFNALPRRERSRSPQKPVEDCSVAAVPEPVQVAPVEPAPAKTAAPAKTEPVAEEKVLCQSCKKAAAHVCIVSGRPTLLHVSGDAIVNGMLEI